MCSSFFAFFTRRLFKMLKLAINYYEVPSFQRNRRFHLVLLNNFLASENNRVRYICWLISLRLEGLYGPTVQIFSKINCAEPILTTQ